MSIQLNRKKASEIKRLSDLYWLVDGKRPRQFSFIGYFDDISQVIQAADLIKEHKAENLRVKFTNFDDFSNIIEIGTATFNLGYWPYTFTEPLMKDLIELLGNLYFWAEVENSDGFSYLIDKDLNVVDIVEADIGG